MTMDELLEHLRDKIEDAEAEAQESHKAAMNSYGAGFDRGYADALKEVLNEIAI